MDNDTTPEFDWAALERQARVLSEHLTKALAAAVEGLAIILDLIIPTIQRLAAYLDQAYRDAYRAAGAPYGETDDGFAQWMQEQADAHRAEADADHPPPH